MWSLIPRPIRRYRREHPYSHPLLFFILDFFVSSVKTAIVCGALYAGYITVISSTVKESSPIAEAAVANEQQSEHNIIQNPTVIPASASSSINRNALAQQNNRANRLLDEKYAVRWIQSLPKSHYVIQFASSTNKASLLEFADNHLQNGAVIFPFKRTSNNEIMYGVASGLYDSLNGALNVIDNLPEPLKEHSPWVRPVAKLQTQVARTI